MSAANQKNCWYTSAIIRFLYIHVFAFFFNKAVRHTIFVEQFAASFLFTSSDGKARNMTTDL